MNQPKFKRYRKTVPFRPGADGEYMAKMNDVFTAWQEDTGDLSSQELAVVVKHWRKGLISLSIDKGRWEEINGR